MKIGHIKIDLLEESTNDEIVKMEITHKNGQFKIVSDGQTIELSKEMTYQIIEYVKSINLNKIDYTHSTNLELRIKQ